MRNALLSRNSQPSSGPSATPPPPIPSIRFISATPSTHEPSQPQIEINMDAYPGPYNPAIPFAAPSATSSPLAPRLDAVSPRKRLVPKKSKIGLLSGSTKAKEKPKASNDFSDVVRRVGANGGSNVKSSGRGGFEIYVDHCEDEDAEIVVVKKKKSRMGLGGVGWGTLGEVTNSTKENRPAAVQGGLGKQENTLKVPKGDENANGKWWSIGRGRKEVKMKEKAPVRSKTPEPFSKPIEPESRARFNSLDSGRLLSSSFTPPRAQASPQVPPKDMPQPQPQPQHPRQRSGTLSSLSTLLSVPGSEHSDSGRLAPPMERTASGSIAVRAMRSMRSLARMKSWANLGADKEGNGNNVQDTNDTNVNTKKNTITKTLTTATIKTKEKKEKKSKKSKETKEKSTQRFSSSSFEAGALSSPTSPMPPPAAQTINKKPSKLGIGLGLPSTMRLAGTVRPSRLSSTSSAEPPTPISAPFTTQQNRLSIGSAHLVMGPNGRPVSGFSTRSASSQGSSLRPPSTVSNYSSGSGNSASQFSVRSPRSSSSSIVSVRWDEEGISNVKQMQRRERESKRERDRQNGMESKHSAEGRRRTAIADIFPEVRSASAASRRSSATSERPGQPIVTIEEATTDGHGSDSEAPTLETPAKKARPRPMSEQMLGKSRPKPIVDDADGVLSILDAATNDLASLINRLDLEATPASTKGSPRRLRKSPSSSSLSMIGQDSPLKGFGKCGKCTFDKKTDAPLLSDHRGSTGSIASLQAYAKSQLKSRAQAHPAVPPTRQQPLNADAARRLIGQQIVPWSELDWQVSPKKPAVRPKGFRPTHKRSPTPSPEVDIAPVFQPLRPAAKNRVASVEKIPSTRSTPVPAIEPSDPSASTFGSETKRYSKIGQKLADDFGDDESAPPSPSPAMKRRNRHSRKSSVLSVICDNGIALAPDALKNLGLKGTLGGPEPEIDPEDPDSDIPEELQVILSGQSDEEATQVFDDTLSLRPRSRAPSPGLPPLAALPTPQASPDKESASDSEPEAEQIPVFRATLYDEEANQADIDEGEGSPSEDDTNGTNKSFDFTGELQKLSESGGSDRRSFVEQIETAFATPARIDLGFELSQKLFVRNDPPPPVPPLPAMYRGTPGEDLVPRSVSDQGLSTMEHSEEPSFRDSGVSDTIDNLIAECEEDFCRQFDPDASMGSMRSTESDGKLNTSFRFGGKPRSPGNLSQPSASPSQPLTLSDIIPPVSHSRNPSQSSMMSEDNSVIKSILARAYQDDTSIVNSILAHAQEVPSSEPRLRRDSDTGSDLIPREVAEVSQASSGSSRPVSMASFTGLESFDEIRRGFEFHPNRPAFYPPPGATSRSNHKKYESIYSIASVSDYGAVINPGHFDPFGFTSGLARPLSDDMSGSVNVDDTFSFLKRDPHRKRVDSDASSFYFRPGQRRSHRRNESNFSMVSNAPPISLYNRSYGAHRRNDSNTSMSSIAHSYAMHGGPGGRNSWARHGRDQSRDSIFSEMSIVNMGRPGLGDKMFDTGRPGLGDKMFEMDYGMPLTAITASPTGSAFSDEQSQHFRQEQPTNLDSVMDVYPRTETDSLFEVTGDRTSIASDPFLSDGSRSTIDPLLRLRQFRPISMMSMSSVHTAAKDDDTMMSIIGGGGHIRRRSVDRNIRDSPCVPVARKKQQTALQYLGRVLQFEHGPDELPSLEENRVSKISPEKVIAEKPSIASTSSYQFGADRMIRAGKGLLERQSLEESALMAQGEDIIASLENTRVFSRPARAGRSRSSTVTMSSGTETPPLSASDTSSVSSGSQSSIDLGHLNTLLTAATQPSSSLLRANTRARPRGAGHRRRYSAARSRSSVYETIQEESFVLSSSSSPEKLVLPDATEKSITNVSMHNDTVIIVDPETASYDEDWTDEHGIVSMRKYYALRDEAEVTVTESKRVWTDTPFSVFAIQSFEPPANRSGMEAMLQHSQKNYGPLPSELRPHRIRSRTSSRASPYPTRGRLISLTSEDRPEMEGKPFASPDEHDNSNSSFVLREISINPNISVFSLPPTGSGDASAFSPFVAQLEKSKEEKTGFARPRVSSGARRSALGWSKRNTTKAKATTDKENSGVPGVTMYTPSDSLRLSRPRPKGRPTPARVPVPRV